MGTELGQVGAVPSYGNGVFGITVQHDLNADITSSSSKVKDQKNVVTGSPREKPFKEATVITPWFNWERQRSSPPSQTAYPGIVERTEGDEALGPTVRIGTRVVERVPNVVGAARTLEWTSDHHTDCGPVDDHRRIPFRLGCMDLPTGSGTGDLEYEGVVHTGRERQPYQLEGAHNSPVRGDGGGGENTQQECSPPHGQHSLHGIREWPGRQNARPIADCREDLAVADRAERDNKGAAPGGSGEQESRRTLEGRGEQIRLVLDPSVLQQPPGSEMGFHGGCFRISSDEEAEPVLGVQSRPRSGSDRCIVPGVGEGVPIPESTGETSRSSLGQTGERRSGRGDHLSRLLGPVDADSEEMQPECRAGVDSDTSGGLRPSYRQSSQPVWDPGMGDSRMACLRQAPSYRNLEQHSWELACKPDPVSDAHWRAYVKWCLNRELDPLSGDRAVPLNFVADKARSLAGQNKQPASAVPYKTTIAKVWICWGLPDISKERITSDLVKGIKARSAHRARYERIFFAGDILDRCRDMGDIKSLPWLDAHRKVAALVAICGACRKDDIAKVQVADITFAAYGNVLLPYAGKTMSTKGVMQITVPHIGRLGAESPARVVKQFLLEREDWKDLKNRPGLILVQEEGGARAAHKDTIGHYLEHVFESSVAKAKMPEEFKFRPHSYKHSAVTSFGVCGMSKEHMEMFCRTSKATLSKWYDHTDRLVEKPVISTYSREVLTAIVTMYVRLNPLHSRRSTRV